jgi:hypothetical protein
LSRSISGTPDRATFFATRTEFRATSPPSEIEEVREPTRRTELPPSERGLDTSLAMIISRLDRMERRFTEVFEPPEKSDDSRSRGSDGARRRETRRETIFTEGGTAMSHGKPKMEKPESFNGEYTVLYSVLNWLRAVRRYLKPHNIPKNMYPQYAYTYMGKTVKAWYDAKFAEIEDPHWELFEQAMTERYLPEDHVIQVTKRYEGPVR